MSKFIIRNDDISYDTDLDSLKRFCEICDRHKVRIIQAIIPVGEYRKSNARMSNEEIIAASGRMFGENIPLVSYLKGRFDVIGVHGLFHTHRPTENEIKIAKYLLQGWGLPPVYFVPPFNEGTYPDVVVGMKVSQLSLKRGERLEDFLKRGTPTAPIMYLHSWRFGDWYTFEQLDECLGRLCQ